MNYSDLPCDGRRSAARLAAMGKQARDRIQIHLTPADRTAIDALLEEIAAGLSTQRGAVAEAALNMLRIGMAIYAAQPSRRIQVPHAPEALRRAVAEAKAREDSAPPMTTTTFERALSSVPPKADDTPPAARAALIEFAMGPEPKRGKRK